MRGTTNSLRFDQEIVCFWSRISRDNVVAHGRMNSGCFMMTNGVEFRKTVNVIGSNIDIISLGGAVERISKWTESREGRYVCLCNVHSLVTARQRNDFGAAIEGADMATPDGAPVAWMMRRVGIPGQQRVCGPDLMLAYCEHAVSRNQSILLLGSTEDTLSKLQANLRSRWPELRITDAISPPFRTLSDKESMELVERINSSGAHTIWVSLGCPKQELWMATHRSKINGVMIGVGAAFDFHAGVVKRAPLWMRLNGLEWLHRLLSEPGRLWRRYFITNSLFLFFAAMQMLFK
jgi:N-acetylglucosaminyldiphosphoundecaprenol N-acetyl-beta-D-mannosaminyltransferase